MKISVIFLAVLVSVGKGEIGEICLGYTGVVLNYVRGSETTFQFDLCDVIGGCKEPGGWRSYDIYICMHSLVHYTCVYGKGSVRRMCPTWNYVNWYTGRDWSPNVPTQWTKNDRDKITFTRGQLTERNHHGSNPLLLSIRDMQHSPEVMWNGTNDRLFLVLGVNTAGQDPKGIIVINWIDPVSSNTAPTVIPVVTGMTRVIAIDMRNLTAGDAVRVATGYGDTNIWVEWIQATARERNMTNCVACSSARPILRTFPAPLLVDTDPQGFYCMLSLHLFDNPDNCTTLSALFPVVSNQTAPPMFAPSKNNYTCLSRNGEAQMGELPATWCVRTINVSSWNNASHFPVHRADLFWYCGERTLFTALPPRWSGTCTIVRLLLPLILLGQKGEPTRGKRSTPSFDLSQGSPTYIDAIGVPRGVPDEYKLADQVASGFENIPIFSALFPVTPNKNIDRINYIHYNVQRLANLTRDAVAGLSEQLAATSLMAVQNRMALDMLLAEKGGVCSMFGDQCCTFIPNNTAPDGSVTRALEGLRTLSKELKENSGIDNSLGKWLDKLFGKWKMIIVSALISLSSAITVLVLCGCCCIPCIRSLCNRIIVTAIEGKQPPSYQMAQFRNERAPLMEDLEEEVVVKVF